MSPEADPLRSSPEPLRGSGHFPRPGNRVAASWPRRRCGSPPPNARSRDWRRSTARPPATGRAQPRQRLHPFAAKPATDTDCDAGDVAARARQVGHQTGSHRIEHAGEHDRDTAGRLLGCDRRRVETTTSTSTSSMTSANRPGMPVRSPFREARLDHDVLAFDVAGLAQARAQLTEQHRIRQGQAHIADAPDLAAVLGLGPGHPGVEPCGGTDTECPATQPRHGVYPMYFTSQSEIRGTAAG